MERRFLMAGAALAGTAFGASAKAADDAAGGLIERFAATLSAHDISAFAALFADDYVNHQVSAAVPPPPPGKTPKELSVAFFAAQLAGMPDLKVTVESSVVTDGKFAASFIYTGTHGGVFFGLPPTGKPLRFTSCDIFAVRGGKLVEHWGMGDIAGVMAQLRS
jgi:steroid delta-isomerase-like uncharacterized protein